MARADQKYFDYLELRETPEPASPRRHWLLAAASTVLLVGASVAYSASKNDIWTDVKGLWHRATDHNLLAEQNGYGNYFQISFPGYNYIQDGRVQYAIVSLSQSYYSNPPPYLQLSAPGIRFARERLYFNQYDTSTYEQRVPCRTTAGATSKGGSTVPVTVTLAYPTSSYKPQKQIIQRQLYSTGRCSAWGDPHITSFDGVAFDFQIQGVFRFVQSRNFQIQVFQHWCPTGRTGPSAPSCYRGVAIAYADSIVRLHLKDNKIFLLKGTESTRWFDIVKFGGATEGYRIFTTVDQTSYVDVTVGVWTQFSYSYMNVVFQASPFFKDPSLNGLMGNWNGDKTDDVTDAITLAAAHNISLDDNLFTCVGDACQQWLLPATDDDELALQVPSTVDKLREGFDPVDPASIPLETYTPVVIPLPARKLQTGGDGGDPTEDTAAIIAPRAIQLCEQSISSVPDCEKYVPNKSFFIYNVCVQDAILVNDLSAVDNTKLSYLRECRRAMEAELAASAILKPDEAEQVAEDHTALAFGDLDKCPVDCNGRGECLAAGCKCDHGFTGYTCDIPV